MDYFYHKEMIMKKIYLSLLTIAVSLSASAQFGVSYHDSNDSFLGLNYTYNNKLFSEFRLGSSVAEEDAYFEVIATYIIRSNSSFDLYLGVGIASGSEPSKRGGVIPAGLNIYPFESKAFGFHTELAYLVVESGGIRGSWGIRYRFL